MKKLLLTLSAVALSATCAFAAPDGLSSFPGAAPVKAPSSRAGEEESIEFTLSQTLPETLNPYALNGVGKRSTMYMAIEFVPANCEMYAGAQITAVSFFSAVNGTTRKNDINEAEVFIISEPGGKDYNPIVSKTGTVGTEPYTKTTIEFDEPYTIKADEPFAVGYKFQVASAKDYYMYVDEIPTDDMEGCWYATGASGKMQWGNLADQIGSLLIFATIKGDNLPQDGISVPLVSMPGYADPGKEFSANVSLKGAAANAVSSVEIEYTVGDKEPVTTEITLEKPVSFGQTTVATISGLSYTTEAVDVAATFKVTKVNGNANTSPANVGTAYFNCFERSKGFDHVHLVEEGTGTWCGWCPRGIVMMEYIAEKYPDTFARIAIHSGDKMEDASCVAVLEYLGLPGYPFMFIDRMIGDDPGRTQYFGDIANNNPPAILGVSELVGKYDAEGNVGISSSVRFTFDTDNSADRYRMSYYVTEDNVGPYNQTNYYSGGGNGKMEGWENKGESVRTIYNEVARVLVGDVTGISNSIPNSQLHADQDYAFYTEGKISKVSTNPYYLTAFIIDNNTGAVVNAKQVTLEYEEESGLTDAAASKLAVRGINGAVEFAGEYTSVAIYNVAGQLVATAAGESTVALPTGLYIIKADNKVSKVIVK